MPDTQPLDQPERIGPYHILQLIGEGGMGIVYEARQTEPVRRHVALKIMKLGMDTKDVVGRFEAERQALAVMDHPGIARVFDAGATERGRPYFVMELVHGTRVDRYCDQERLSTRRRVELFIEVCEAVQHAHQKGVIHRDLKPANVLVAGDAGRARPKIIDFGIAKATSQHLTDRTVVTTYGQAVGTLAYMSPEQASGELDVDTRADVYSLGVMLYELLTGRVPLDPREVGAMVFLAQLTARDITLPTVLQGLSRTGKEQLEQVLLARGTDFGSLRRELAGDLEWIVVKAMEKDRDRRYETANGLAEDLRRYLADEPVVARPPTTVYRLRKFVRRNRAWAAGGAVAVLALLAGAILATAGMLQARTAERDALREAATAAEVSDFLRGLFRVNNPSAGRGTTVTARELLDSAAVGIRSELATQPEVQASLLLSMGDAYQGLGMYAESEGLLREGLALRESTRPPDDPGVAEALSWLGLSLSFQGENQEALQVLERARTIQEARLGPSAPELAQTLSTLGAVYEAQGRFAEAEPPLKRVVEIRESAFGPSSMEVALGLGGLGNMYRSAGRLPEADSLLSRSLEIRERVLGPDHPDVALALNNLGGVRWGQGRLDDAERMFQRSLEIRTRTLGPDHPELGDTYNNLGILRWMAGDYAEAERLYGRALEIFEAALGPEHYKVALALNNIAETQWKQGRLEEAEATFRRSLAIKEKIQPAHPSVATGLNGLANVYREGGRFEEADSLFRRALEIREAALGGTDPAVVETLTDWAAMLREAGRGDEAARLEERLEAIRSARGGGDSGPLS